MNPLNQIQNVLRPLLWTLGLPYRLAVVVRNKAFDNGWAEVHHFPVKIISIGNLEVGGTGKTPHVEWLIEKLGKDYNIGIVSRGYGRKSLGVLDARTNESSEKIGDEPLQIHMKFPDLPMVVAEKRAAGIDFMLRKYPEVSLIILDDAFQHRAVHRHADILLTRESRLYTADSMMPAGRLREPRLGRRRAQFIICTHTTKPQDKNHRLRIKTKLRLSLNQSLYFTSMQLIEPRPLADYVNRAIADNRHHSKDWEVISATGIANPDVFHEQMKGTYKNVEERSYNDHHAFTEDDLNMLTEKLHKPSATGRAIAITEKDAVKWAEMYVACNLKEYEIWVWPLKVKMEAEDEAGFLTKLKALLEQNN